MKSLKTLQQEIMDTDPQWQQHINDELKRLFKEHEIWQSFGKPPVGAWSDIKQYLFAKRWGDKYKKLHYSRKLKHMGVDVEKLTP